jgi:hypothetical protein
VPNAPAASCALCSFSMHTSIHSGGTGYIRHSPRNGFNSLYRALPGDRALLPPSPSRNCVPRKLSASVGAPGPHDFAVRAQRRSSSDTTASTASRPTFVTTRTPLLPWRDGGNNTQFLIFGKRNICAWRTDNPNRLESAHEIRFRAHAFWRCLRPSARRQRRRIDQTDSPVGSGMAMPSRPLQCGALVGSNALVEPARSQGEHPIRVQAGSESSNVTPMIVQCWLDRFPKT